MDNLWAATAALVDRGRRALYEYASARDAPVSRDEAARAVGISRKLAAFHLDKLVEVGLLTAGYAGPGDRHRGPGRSPKVYRPSGLEISLHIPERRYELLGDILAEAVARAPEDARTAALRIAGERGRDLGRAARTPDSRDGVRTLLADLGFEPHEPTAPVRPAPPADVAGPAADRPAPPAGDRAGGGGLVLGNCPFHRLARREPELVCGINQAFLAGLLTGLGDRAHEAVLAPGAGRCCVWIVDTGHTLGRSGVRRG